MSEPADSSVRDHLLSAADQLGTDGPLPPRATGLFLEVRLEHFAQATVTP